MIRIYDRNMKFNAPRFSVSVAHLYGWKEQSALFESMGAYRGSGFNLLVNGALADVLLFGTFLIWAVVDRVSMKQRATRPVPGLKNSKVNDAIVIVIGLSI